MSCHFSESFCGLAVTSVDLLVRDVANKNVSVHIFSRYQIVLLQMLPSQILLFNNSKYFLFHTINKAVVVVREGNIFNLFIYSLLLRF